MMKRTIFTSFFQYALLATVLLLNTVCPLWAQTEVVFTTSGTFTVPANVNAITVEVIGGGGSGGNNGSGGGGGGGYSKGIFTVTPSSNLAVIIGSGGLDYLDGGTTSVGNLISATGGKKGGSVNNPNVGGGGMGGVGTGGTINYTGGNGGGGYYTYFGGGGGGAAGPIANGSNGSNTGIRDVSNGICVNILGANGGVSGGAPAGNGGKGAGYKQDCSNDSNELGLSYGGGGGGGNGGSISGGNVFSVTGKAGANGYCKIAYTTVSTPASTYCLTYKPVRTGNTVDLYVYLLANTAFKLGAGNLQFKYKSAVLSTPTLQSEVLTATTKYSGISLTSPMPIGMAIDEALVSLNFNFTGTTGQGLSIGTTGEGTQIGVIRFTITDPATSPNIRPYESVNGTAMIVYDDNTTSPTLLASTGSCATYNYPLSTTFAYSAAAFCKSALAQTPTVTGTSGGTYSSTPAGLTLNTTTGQITPSTSTAGTYSVYYNIPSAGNGQALTTVTINALPTPTITGLNTVYCANATPVNIAINPAGGIFTINGVPITNFNPANFNPAALTLATTHTVAYTYTDANGCSGTISQAVTIYPVPAAITGTPSVNVSFTVALANTVIGGTWSSSNPAIATVHSTTGVVTGVSAGTVNITYSLTNSCGTNTVTKSVTVLRNSVQVSLKAYLEGPYSAGMMSDGLRSGGTIPATQPYTGMAGFTHVGGGGSETVASSVLAVSGNNAIVDWIFVELRDKTTPATVLYTRAALIQRDGDIVDTDGVSPLSFLDVIPDNFYIAIKHRNHLGFRTSAVQSLTSTPLSLNLTNGTIPVFGTIPLKNVSGVYFMYSGEGDGNGVINAIDLNSVWLPKNGLNTYLRADFDMNGIVNATDLVSHWLINNSRIQQLD